MYNVCGSVHVYTTLNWHGDSCLAPTSPCLSVDSLSCVSTVVNLKLEEVRHSCSNVIVCHVILNCCHMHFTSCHMIPIETPQWTYMHALIAVVSHALHVMSHDPCRNTTADLATCRHLCTWADYFCSLSSNFLCKLLCKKSTPCTSCMCCEQIWLDTVCFNKYMCSTMTSCSCWQ